MGLSNFRSWVAVFWAAVVLLTCGCTSVAPYRYTLVPAPTNHFYPETRCSQQPDDKDQPGNNTNPDKFKKGPPSEMDECYSASVERTKNYTLFFIEFDEQGRFYDRRQLGALTDYLLKFKKNAALKSSEKNCKDLNDGLSIVTFVHGWRNNARYDNGNVILARQILDFTYAGEIAGTQFNPAHCPREVIGVYASWRGLSTATNDLPKTTLSDLLGSPWEAISVWDRKNTAQNVAVGSVRELFSILKVYQDDRNYAALKDKQCAGQTENKIYLCKPVRHLIVGHSFGALIVNNAVSQQLLESVTRGIFADPNKDCSDSDDSAGGQPGASVVRSYADLIILLNPAVEGARYEPLQEVVSVRARKPWREIGAFCPNQKPVLIVLTSEGDWATDIAFKFVRATATVFESSSPQNDNYVEKQRKYIGSEEGRSSISTLGHNPRYHTHELTSWDQFVKTYSGDIPRVAAPDPIDIAAAADLKIYAKAFADACSTQPADPMEAALNQLRCMNEKAAEDLLKIKESGICGTLLTDIHLSRMLLGRSKLQWPAGGDTGTQTEPVPYWVATFAGGSTLRHLRDYEPSREKDLKDVELNTEHSPASPIWNIYVKDRSIMKGHSDINSARLLLLLQQLYHSVVLKSFDPDVLKNFGGVAGEEYRNRCNPQPLTTQTTKLE